MQLTTSLPSAGTSTTALTGPVGELTGDGRAPEQASAAFAQLFPGLNSAEKNGIVPGASAGTIPAVGPGRPSAGAVWPTRPRAGSSLSPEPLSPVIAVDARSGSPAPAMAALVSPAEITPVSTGMPDRLSLNSIVVRDLRSTIGAANAPTVRVMVSTGADEKSEDLLPDATREDAPEREPDASNPFPVLPLPSAAVPTVPMATPPTVVRNAGPEIETGEAPATKISVRVRPGPGGPMIAPSPRSPVAAGSRLPAPGLEPRPTDVTNEATEMETGEAPATELSPKGGPRTDMPVSGPLPRPSGTSQSIVAAFARETFPNAVTSREPEIESGDAPTTEVPVQAGPGVDGPVNGTLPRPSGTDRSNRAPFMREDLSNVGPKGEPEIESVEALATEVPATVGPGTDGPVNGMLPGSLGARVAEPAAVYGDPARRAALPTPPALEVEMLDAGPAGIPGPAESTGAPEVWSGRISDTEVVPVNGDPMDRPVTADGPRRNPLIRAVVDAGRPGSPAGAEPSTTAPVGEPDRNGAISGYQINGYASSGATAMPAANRPAATSVGPGGGRAANLAATYGENIPRPVSGGKETAISFLSASPEEVLGADSAVGTGVAKSVPVMAANTFPRPPSSEPDGRLVPPVAVNEPGDWLKPAVASSAQTAASAAHRAVNTILEATERLAANETHSLNLRFSVGGSDLAVQVELREGELRATFRTDSPELRTALAQEWQAVSGSEAGRPLRTIEPVFSPAKSPSADAALGEGASQQQRHPEARQTAEAPAPRGPAPAVSTPHSVLGSGSPAVRSAPLPTTLRLHAFA